METLVKEDGFDVIIHSAAVSDYKVNRPSPASDRSRSSAAGDLPSYAN